jgi:hypothetical protein
LLTKLYSVDGGWSQWGSWICDKKSGEKNRVRECSNPFSRNEGLSCLGNIDETDICMRQHNHKMDDKKETNPDNGPKPALVSGALTL